MKLCKDGEGTETSLIQGKAERLGTVQPGEGNALEGIFSMYVYKYMMGRCKDCEIGLFSVMARSSGTK